MYCVKLEPTNQPTKQTNKTGKQNKQTNKQTKQTNQANKQTNKRKPLEIKYSGMHAPRIATY